MESLAVHYLDVVLLRDFGELTTEEIKTQIGMIRPGVCGVFLRRDVSIGWGLGHCLQR